MDTSRLMYPKPTPNALVKRAKSRAEDTEWRRVCRLVDTRDQRRCQVTGKRLSADAVDPWRALERHHLEARSQSKSRRFTATNVLTVSRAIHQLLHAGALNILDKRGRKALDVRTIDHVSWNRTLVPRSEEPCTVILPVLKDGPA